MTIPCPPASPALGFPPPLAPAPVPGATAPPGGPLSEPCPAPPGPKLPGDPITVTEAAGSNGA